MSRAAIARLRTASVVAWIWSFRRGKSATTSKSGTASISFRKGTKTGRYTVAVTAPDYFAAHGTLHVKS
jgi:PKD domain